MIDKKTWAEFRECGLLWWVNRTLHPFGWAIVIEFDDDGEVIGAYPARCKFRGFDDKSESAGFAKLSRHIAENAQQNLKEVEE